MYGDDCATRSIGGGEKVNMKILYITNHLNIGGITSYVLMLASAMVKKGHAVFLASSGGELTGLFENAGIKYIHIPINTKSEISPKILLSFLRLRKFIKDNGIGIIHVNSRTTQVLAYYLSRSCRIPYLSTCHGFFKVRFSRRKFPCWGAMIIAISEPVKKHLIDDFKLPESNIEVIRNGIDIDKFVSGASIVTKSQARKRLGLKDDEVIGTIGRLSDVKGQRYLIAAMPGIMKHFPRAQLLIVGCGKIKNNLVKLSKNLGVDKNVVFTPALKDTREALAAMDIFVMPSLEEGLGLALMEAMAFGLAVVGTKVGGIIDLVKTGENGILVEPKDSTAIASAVVTLLSDNKKAKELSAAAREYIISNFSQDKMSIGTESLYYKILTYERI